MVTHVRSTKFPPLARIVGLSAGRMRYCQPSRGPQCSPSGRSAVMIIVASGLSVAIRSICSVRNSSINSSASMSSSRTQLLDSGPYPFHLTK